MEHLVELAKFTVLELKTLHRSRMCRGTNKWAGNTGPLSDNH